MNRIKREKGIIRKQYLTKKFGHIESGEEMLRNIKFKNKKKQKYKKKYLKNQL